MVVKVLRLDDWQVKRAAQHDAINGKKPFARGAFSAIYDGSKPNTVFKLTADSFSYWMLNCGSYGVTHRHFPKVIKSYDHVGDFSLNDKMFPLYLFEIERLEKTKGECRRLASEIVRRLSHFSVTAWQWPQPDRAMLCIQEILRDKTLPRSVLNAFAQLEEFCCNYPGSALDMHLGNFMQRKNGELVITDPIMDKAAMSARQSTIRHSYY